MSDLDEIHAQLAKIMESQAQSRVSQARTEETVKDILAEAKKTNGRVTKTEIWQTAHDLAEAGQEGLRLGRAEAFITKRQMAFAVGSIGAIAGTITSVVTLIVRFL